MRSLEAVDLALDKLAEQLLLDLLKLHPVGNCKSNPYMQSSRYLRVTINAMPPTVN